MFQKDDLFDDINAPGPTKPFTNHVGPLAVPKLNLQFLSINEYLSRLYRLYQLESFYGIRGDVEDVIRRLDPFFNIDGEGVSGTAFKGWARYGVAIDSVSILIKFRE